MNYFSSDFHLGHKNVLRFDNRPFDSIGHHDDAIIHNVNETMDSNDSLFFLGDFTMSRSKNVILAYFRRFRQDINIHLIYGNHDDVLQKLAPQLIEERLILSARDANYIRCNRQKIYISHYSCRTWRSAQHGAWHLYGHSHGKLESQPYGRSMDVAIHLHNYKPLSFDQVAAVMERRTVLCIDHAVKTT